ncbi:MAG: Transcriptional regulatory protein ZraR [Alphaproteobacteria bacterium ADurb.BinA280]|jgi:two-component system, NtrC family, response regulator HydG|nr:sigma-54-dependent Fis family transcriptional regulator [Xanthomonadales bacterium]MCC6506868.1 sigma-54-dependent Fis family transcriptional regulator [Aquimonas sp.]OPZ13292.1 MAG: Transcriptional regulatory protein ZraR [Alphaproteobacteria bacterium ADurb.BinA280]
MQPLAELIAYLDSLPEPHILFDGQYRILAANAAYRAQFQREESVIGRTCYQVSHGINRPCDQAGESCPLAAAKQSGQRERVLHLHHTPQGDAYVGIELVPIRDASGEARYFVERMESLALAQSVASPQGLVGRSTAFQRMLSLMNRVAPSEASVLLLGESGTGKELVAQALHRASARQSGPMVVVDCASLPESLFEAELFGHERGAFTGASAARRGLVESASGGTLFLDEVGDIPLGMQVKLLRLLESGTYRRVGSSDLRHADIRLVSATHRDLPQRVRDGLFRQDLYFRIATFPIRLPSLRERRADVPLLAGSMLARLAGARAIRLTDAAMVRLSTHDFPGNIRELRNLLERALLLTDGDVISAETLDAALALESEPAVLTQPVAPRSRPRAWSDEDLLRHAAAHHGSRRELAQQLGISERSLYRKLRSLGTAH